MSARRRLRPPGRRATVAKTYDHRQRLLRPDVPMHSHVAEEYWTERMHSDMLPTVAIAIILQAISDFLDDPPKQPPKMIGDRACRYRKASECWLDSAWFIFSDSPDYPNLKYFCDSVHWDINKIRVLILSDKFGVGIDKGGSSPYPRFGGVKPQGGTMAGAYKAEKLGKRPETGPSDVNFTGTMSNKTKDNTGKAGSFTNRSSAYSISPGSGPKKKA